MWLWHVAQGVLGFLTAMTLTNLNMIILVTRSIVGPLQREGALKNDYPARQMRRSLLVNLPILAMWPILAFLIPVGPEAFFAMLILGLLTGGGNKRPALWQEFLNKYWESIHPEALTMVIQRMPPMVTQGLSRVPKEYFPNAPASASPEERFEGNPTASSLYQTLAIHLKGLGKSFVQDELGSNGRAAVWWFSMGSLLAALEAGEPPSNVKTSRAYLRVRPLPEGLSLAIVLTRKVESQRPVQTHHFSTATVTVEVDVRSPEDFDDELLEWLREAYDRVAA